MAYECYRCHLDIVTCETDCVDPYFIYLKESMCAPAATCTPGEVTIIFNDGKEEDTDEVEKIIDDALPEIIKERMKEENAKVRIRNKRRSIRNTLGQ